MPAPPPILPAVQPLPYNSVGGYSTGLTMTGVIDSLGNITGVGATFSGLIRANAGISAAGGVTLAGTLQGTTANFTGLVSSTVGFSGPGTNITGVVTSFNNQTGAVTGVTVGGTNIFTALNTFSAGISAAGGITLSGTLSLDTNALISSPSATAKAIRSTVPAGTGVTPTVQIICPSSAQTLLNQTATQPVFSTAQDTITLQAATTYMFEGQYLITSNTASHQTAMSFVLTTATMTNCTWTAITSPQTSLNTAAAGAAFVIFDNVAGGYCNSSATTIANLQIVFKGIMRVNAAGTLVPNIAFSAAPGTGNSTLVGSYITFYPIGSNTIDFVGSAIG